MSRYIDADALNQDYQGWYKLFDWDDGGAEKATIARAIRILNDQPTADVVEVVRCRDCKYASDNNRICYKHQHPIFIESDGFCKWGERRKDG